MGRWMSPDWSASVAPVPYADLSNPQSLNLYAYLGNNPVMGVDRDGHMSAQMDGWGVDHNGVGGGGLSSYLDSGGYCADEMYCHGDSWPGPSQTWPEQQQRAAQQANAQAFQAVWDAFPSYESYGTGTAGKSGMSIQQLTGVDVVDTCALRMSYALNQSGYTISKSDGKSAMKGSDAHYYLVSQKDVGNFIRRTFGITPQIIGKAGIGTFETAFEGKQGFVRFNIQFNHPGNIATGHIALWNGENFRSLHDYYTVPSPNGGYVVKSIEFYRMH
jgi:hypothetical protein